MQFAMGRSEAHLLRDKAAAILWVKSQMARHAISFDELEAAGCFEKTTPPPASTIRYKDAQGHTWDGNGDLPDWLQRAVNAGQSADHFRV